MPSRANKQHLSIYLNNMKTTLFKISGMTCSSCGRIVTKRLKAIEGVKSVEVSVEKGVATVEAPREIGINEAETVLKDTHYNVASGT